MWGADTPLVIDALTMAGFAALAGGALVAGIWKLRKPRKPKSTAKPDDHEDRIRVLERIATDRSQDLSDEIEALRKDAKIEEKIA